MSTSSANGLKVVIVGGGIGGVTAAFALRAAGIKAVVLERATDVRTIYVGSGIHIWNNAMRALKEMGLDDRAMAISGPGAVVDEMQYVTDKGRILGVVDCAAFGERVGAPCVGVNRAELLPSLADGLEEGVLRMGCEVTGFEQDSDGVRALLADGGEERGDVLIGADGVHSKVREQLHGVVPPRYAGYTIWQGIASVTPEVAPVGIFPIIYGAGLRFAYYRVSDERLYWFAVANAPEGGKDPPGESKRLMLERFAGWSHPVQEIIGMTDPDKIHRRDLYDRDPIARWGEGRVTLLGDAAHAMTFDLGQGAGQSIEDAYELARCLGGASDPGAALREYEQLRVKRTKHFVMLSRRVGQIGAWENPVAVKARVLLALFMLRTKLITRAFDKDLAYTWDRSRS